MKKILFLLTALLLSSCTANNSSTPPQAMQNNDKIVKPNTPVITNNTQTPMNNNQANLNLKNQTITLETNFGTLNIKMLDDIAPKTTENFIRLSAKGYYDNTKFHRIVKSDSFSIIQGGDPTATGRGGESIWGQKFEDEVFDNNKKLPTIYGEFFNNQYCVYQKGLIAMANAGPNTNGSQFFVMLGNTKLPPSYTIFGQIDETDFPVLDKIVKEVDTNSPTGDGMPNQEIKILSAKSKEASAEK